MARGEAPYVARPMALKLARVAAGLTQAQLAHAAGVERHVILRAEKGGVPRSYLTQVAIAAALGADPEQFWPSADEYDPEWKADAVA